MALHSLRVCTRRETPPEKCPNCEAPKEKFELPATSGPDLIDWNKIGVAKDSGFESDLEMQFKGECMEVGMYIAMARQAEREGYTEIAETMKRIAWEEAHHAARFAELLGDVLSDSTEENLKRLVDGEAGANRGKKISPSAPRMKARTPSTMPFTKPARTKRGTAWLSTGS